MKLRLFVVRDTQTNTTASLDFSDKSEAKKERDRLGGAPRYVVSYGPDHRKAKTKNR